MKDLSEARRIVEQQRGEIERLRQEVAMLRQEYAADTAEITKLNEMLDEHRGEIARLKAKLEESEKDAGRYRYIKGLARKSEAYDKFTWYHWQIGLYNPKCVGFDSAIDAMIRGRARASQCTN